MLFELLTIYDFICLFALRKRRIEMLESIDDAPLTAAERTYDHEKLLTAHEKKLEAASGTYASLIYHENKKSHTLKI